MPSRKRAPLGRQAAVLAKLQMTRWRQKAWRDRPEHMEAIRQRATARAKAKRDDQIGLLRVYLADLPERMTGPELDDLIVTEYAATTEDAQPDANPSPAKGSGRRFV